MVIANWASNADWECHRDDCGHDSIQDLVFPCGVLLKSWRSLGKAKEMALADLTDQCEMTDDTMPKGKWKCLHKNKESQTWEWTTKKQNDLGIESLVLIARQIKTI